MYENIYKFFFIDFYDVIFFIELTYLNGSNGDIYIKKIKHRLLSDLCT